MWRLNQRKQYQVKKFLTAAEEQDNLKKRGSIGAQWQSRTVASSIHEQSIVVNRILR